jgi:MFS family permease
MNLVAAALGVAQTIAWACTYYLPAVIAGPVASEFEVPLALVVGAFSAALLVAGVAAPRIGRAIEARGGRGVLALSAPVLAAGLALMGLLPGLAGWVLAWLVTGLGMAMGLYDAAFSTLGRLYGGSARRAITIVTLFAGFASTLAFPAGAVLLPELGWRGLCLLYAALQLAVVLPLYLACVPRAAATALAPALSETVADEAALRGAFRWLALFFTLRTVISAIFAVHLILLLQGLGLTLGAAVGVAAAVGAAQVGGRLMEFTLGARAHPMTVARAGAALLPLGLVGLQAGPAMGLLTLSAAALLFALAYGTSNGILTISRGALPLALFGPQGYAVRMGRLARPNLVAGALAPALAAPLVEHLPAALTFALAGCLASLALAALWAVRPPAG